MDLGEASSNESGFPVAQYPFLLFLFSLLEVIFCLKSTNSGKPLVWVGDLNPFTAGKPPSE